MKKLLSILILLTALLSLASCSGAFLPSESTTVTTPESTPLPISPPETTTEPTPPPPPEPLTEAEQIARIAALLRGESVKGVSAVGSACLTYADGSERILSVKGGYLCGQSSLASLVFTATDAATPFCELYLENRTLYLLCETEEGLRGPHRFSELAAFETLRERSEALVSELLSLHGLLSEHAVELDALLGLSGEALSTRELLALVSVLGELYTDGLRELGIELAATLGDGASVEDAASAIYRLCAEYDANGERITLTPTQLLSMLSELYAALEARLDRTVTSILDERLGAGQTAELYRRLASFTGGDPLSAWRDEVESILVSEGLSPDVFYGVLASVLDRSMTAEMTVERLMKLLQENAEKPLDHVIETLWDGKTYSDLLRDLHSILSMPPTSIYTAFGGVGDLRERVLRVKADFDRYADTLSFSLAFSVGEGLSLSLSLSVGEPLLSLLDNSAAAVGASLSLVFEESEELPTPSDRILTHPDFQQS